MYNSTDNDALQAQLPVYHPNTRDWVRPYQPPYLLAAMRRLFPHYHARVCLIALVGAFETALSRLWQELAQRGMCQAKGASDLYKSRLDWAFDRLAATRYGTQGMLQRLDSNRRIADNARRLRNCFLHEVGQFTAKYEDDAISIRGKSDLSPRYIAWKSDHSQPRTALLDQGDFEEMYAAHIELLHQLHDVLQRQDLGYNGPGYSYADEQKPIDWSRILTR